MPKGKRKERIIICDTCGKEVVTTGSRTLRCQECGEQKGKLIRQKAQKEKRVIKWDGNESDHNIWFCDSPENIQKCLNCKRPTCHNCLRYKNKRRKQ